MSKKKFWEAPIPSKSKYKGKKIPNTNLNFKVNKRAASYMPRDELAACSEGGFDVYLRNGQFDFTTWIPYR